MAETATQEARSDGPNRLPGIGVGGVEAVAARLPADANPLPEDERVERALLAVAYFNGSARKASEFLAEDGIEIHPSTLEYWKRKSRKDEYERVRQQVLPQVRQRAVESHLALADTLMERNAELAARLAEEKDNIPARDIPGAIRNISTAAAIETDKAQLLDGQPTDIIGRPDTTAILRSLQGRGVVIDAEVVDEETVETGATNE